MEEPRVMILVSSSGIEVCTEARKEEELCRAVEKVSQELEMRRKVVVKIEFTSQTISFKGI
jgi:TATA-box binding protein (TBP) (component of TFIID and TFIIIB)